MPTAVGADFRWNNHDAHLFTLLTGAVLDVWARAGGQDIRVPARSGAAVEVELLLSRKPEASSGQQFLVRASTDRRLEESDGRWRWLLAFTGESINAACPPSA